MTTREKTQAIQRNLTARGITLDYGNAQILRRAERTLHRWNEGECGNGNNYMSWSIERDDETGKPYLCTYPHTGSVIRRAIADREKGALGRIAKVCQEHGLYYYHQTDPRGASLYVSKEPLTDRDYVNGACCCAD